MTKLFGAAIAALLLTGSTAAAIPVNWELTPISRGGITASGGFTYDADTDVFSNIDFDITTPEAPSFGLAAVSGTATMLLESGNSFTSAASSTSFSFFSTSGPDFLNAVFINFDLASPLTNAGGVLTGGFAEIRHCNNSDCTSAFGTLAPDPTLTGTPATVPLPASGILLLAGLGALAARGRKRG